MPMDQINGSVPPRGDNRQRDDNKRGLEAVE